VRFRSTPSGKIKFFVNTAPDPKIPATATLRIFNSNHQLNFTLKRSKQTASRNIPAYMIKSHKTKKKSRVKHEQMHLKNRLLLFF